MELNLSFRKVNEDGKENKKRIFFNKVILEFKTNIYIILFIYDLWSYVISFFMGLLVLILYYNDIKLYSIFKNKIIEKLNLYGFTENIIIFNDIQLLFFILFFLLFFILLVYKMKTKEEFKRWIRMMIYYRINFLINYNIFIKIFNINTLEFIEYNFVIIIIFLLYGIMQIISIILKRELKLKLLHYLNWPWLSLSFWIFIYLNITNVSVFESLYNDFVGYDDKYYEVAYKNLRSDFLNINIVSEKKNG